MKKFNQARVNGGSNYDSLELFKKRFARGRVGFGSSYKVEVLVVAFCLELLSRAKATWLMLAASLRARTSVSTLVGCKCLCTDVRRVDAHAHYLFAAKLGLQRVVNAPVTQM